MHSLEVNPQNQELNECNDADEHNNEKKGLEKVKDSWDPGLFLVESV
jgi:hypothetical protein